MDSVELRPNRRTGAGYGVLTAVVLLLVLAGVVAYLGSGRLLMAVVTAVVGLSITGFLTVITAALLLPALTADRSGVRGRTARGARLAATWDDITLDVGERAAPGTLRITLNGETLTLTGRSWSGFRDFVTLVAGTPAAASRLTPPAFAEVRRLTNSP
ncbi:hypothetical protein KOI35_27460 [Actinoplanes bogorensis]|uniref:PH domain-containing protein n=1 Tax=Paractinoplanes bogorensis TaxID=1610840 RepID=A0ABS5YV58_9ACTN|nr:hypothetical protein [Actinoplanes bogorensis]MBU2667253.1 hypothetical protein [Actinoplanes bogorensis]